MISMDKEYRTRDGREVRVLCVDRKEDDGYSVVALIVLRSGRESIEIFDLDGMYVRGRESVNDLIEVKPRIVREVLLNVHANGSVTAHSTKDIADRYATIDRIACVKVSIDCEHGEGLNDKESQ